MATRGGMNGGIGGRGGDFTIGERMLLPCGATLGFDEKHRLIEIRVPAAPEADAYGRRRLALRQAEEFLGHPLRLTYWSVGADEYVMAEPQLSEPRDSLALFMPANENGAFVPVG